MKIQEYLQINKNQHSQSEALPTFISFCEKHFYTALVRIPIHHEAETSSDTGGKHVLSLRNETFEVNE